ncbi:MAG: SDR family NAD(P)-dependent oxidoreductase, partial [Pseudomonadota bacterium]
MLRIVLLVTLAVVTASVAMTSRPALAEETKAVLITGASTGIGRHLAETLAGAGYHVYAGARKKKDLAELDAIDNITAVRLDVTSQEEVDAAVALISSSGSGLWGLVNNAGVGGGGGVVDTPIEDQNFVFDV